MTFGEKLQKLRQKAGMSQDALAERLDVSRQAVSRWERDETMPETDKVVALADLFGVTTDYLLRQGAEEEPQAAQPAASAPHKDSGRDILERLGYLAKTKGYAGLGAHRLGRAGPCGPAADGPGRTEFYDLVRRRR